MRSGKPLSMSVPIMIGHRKIPPTHFVTMLVPYEEDRKDLELICLEVLGPAPYRNAGRPLYPQWVNIVIEATYFGEGSGLCLQPHPVDTSARSWLSDLLRYRGTRFLLALLDRADLVAALVTTRALGTPTSVAQFLESIS